MYSNSLIALSPYLYICLGCIMVIDKPNFPMYANAF